MVTFGNIVQATIFIGPWILPRALAFYRSIRASSHTPNAAVREPPSKVQRCLNVLFAAVVVSVILSFPYFAPENIFKATNARLGLDSNLLVSRLNALRQGALTDTDKLFLEKLENEPKMWRYIYAAYGPEVALTCPFCQANEPQSYLYYALPGIAVPHLIHIFLLGLITSSFFSGAEGSRWRTHATIAGVALALIELYTTWNYKWEANVTKRMLGEVDFFYARMRVYRHLAFAATDAIFGWVLYLTSTNRWLVKPPSTTQQLSEVAQQLAGMHAQVNLLANLRNATVRDAELRQGQEMYWRREQEEMAGIMQDDNVRSAVTSVLAKDEYDKTRQRARAYVDQVLSTTLKAPTPTSSTT
ncbi:uncharacterized protein PV09_03909 [Verruconis gallopava]|uniref:Uncharacterized protein n=1 Tax=Verruconis gallopava TaxID=253628 RepID=A0A0D2B261_9PEZI|nr:uncharacterized protein PV09_03909 [Verruconis gallopava]KIW05394.1 hypothetical protein PV09_03909 [Verruconis gallopava]